MGKRQIWPVKGTDKIVTVDDSTYQEINQQILNGPDTYTPARLWEFARRILEKEQTAREKDERHARGDYGPELTELGGYVSDVINRVDAKPYEVAASLGDKIEDCREGGFTVHDANRLMQLHDKLVAEQVETGALIAKVGNLIKELRGNF